MAVGPNMYSFQLVIASEQLLRLQHNSQPEASCSVPTNNKRQEIFAEFRRNVLPIAGNQFSGPSFNLHTHSMILYLTSAAVHGPNLVLLPLYIYTTLYNFIRHIGSHSDVLYTRGSKMGRGRKGRSIVTVAKESGRAP